MECVGALDMRLRVKATVSRNSEPVDEMVELRLGYRRYAMEKGSLLSVLLGLSLLCSSSEYVVASLLWGSLSDQCV
jgi:hypothetical protein